MLDEPSKSSQMKSEPINDDVETCSLLIDESFNNWRNNTTNLFFITLVTSNFISSSSLDDDELELFKWCEGFSIKISIIKKQYLWNKSITIQSNSYKNVKVTTCIITLCFNYHEKLTTYITLISHHHSRDKLI